MSSHYAEAFVDPRQNGFEFMLPNNDIVSEEAEEYYRTKDTGEAEDRIEAVSYDSNLDEDIHTPLPKYENQSSLQPDCEEGKEGEQVEGT